MDSSVVSYHSTADSRDDEKSRDLSGCTQILLDLTDTVAAALGSLDSKDVIHQCGSSCLQIMDEKPEVVMTLAHEKLHTWPYKEVPSCWRRLYEEASLWKAVAILKRYCKVKQQDCLKSRKRGRDGKVKAMKELVSTVKGQGRYIPNDGFTDVVKVLDMALILTGAPKRKDMIMTILDTLRDILDNLHQQLALAASSITLSFPDKLATRSYNDTFERASKLDFMAFQSHLDKRATPLIVSGALEDWPAIADPGRKWSDPSYLLQITIGGRRLVPVELGRSYTDQDWGQKIMTFAEYVHKFLLEPHPTEIGYLAQHDLIDQIPALDRDTITPDYCYTSPPSATVSGVVPQPQLDEPLRNAWLGPAGTISPLHTDPYHNILCQVVGHKYIRLYAPSETSKLYPRGVDEAGVSMENTSHVDVSLARKFYDNDFGADNGEGGVAIDGSTSETTLGDKRDALASSRAEMEVQYPLFKDAEYIEGVLGPGECLYIPLGWWHYVESLSTSFSVSYWFN